MALRVMWVTGNFTPQIGGLEVYIERAVSSLADLSDVRLITQHRQDPPADRRVSHAAIPNLSRPQNQMDWDTASRQLREEVERFSPEIVHFASAGVAAYRESIPPGIPVVATVHGNDLTAPWQWVPGKNALERIVAALSKCDRVFAVSSHTGSLVERYGVTAPVSVLTAGCDTDFFAPVASAGERIRRELGIPAGRPIVLTVGRLVQRKGHECILKAIGALSREVQWVVVGNGPKRNDLAEAVHRSGIADRVSMLGHVTADELLLLYNACDLFVLMPEERHFDSFVDSEGFGLVFQEAGACGRPVIGSDISGCRDAVIDGATGLLTPPGNSTALAAAMERILGDPVFAEQLGQRALSFVRASGGWPRFARQTLEHYGDIIAEGTSWAGSPSALSL